MPEVLTHFSRNTDLSVFLYSCKQAGAKIRAHIKGPLSWLKPVCLQHHISSFFLNIAKNKLFQVSEDRFFMAAILYSQTAIG